MSGSAGALPRAGRPRLSPAGALGTYGQAAQHAEPPVTPPKAHFGLDGSVQSASVLQLGPAHVVVSMQTGVIVGAPHPAPPPLLWHSPWPHEPHTSQAPVMHGGPVVVVVLVVAVVVVLIGTGAQIIFGVVTGSVRFPNWSAKASVAPALLGHLTL